MFDSLVLSGGGTKGIIQLGMLHYFWGKQISLHTLKECVGVSIGSVICALLVCGFTPIEIFTKIYSEKNLIPTTKVNLLRVWTSLGLFPITIFSSKIKDFILSRHKKVPTFEELYSKTGILLTILACNVTKMEETIFNVHTTPSLDIISAIEMSCNLPLIFQRIQYLNNFMSDGGLINNFPTNLISNSCEKTLACVVSSSTNTCDDKMNYLLKMILMPINASTELRCENLPDKFLLLKCIWNRNTPFFAFDLTTEEKMEMFLVGYELSKFENESEKLFLVSNFENIENEEKLETNL